MTDLLSCPFCGGPVTNDAVWGGIMGFECPRCASETCFEVDTDDQSITAWNTRALLPALMTVREAFKDGISEAMANALQMPFFNTAKFLGAIDAAIKEAQE